MITEVSMPITYSIEVSGWDMAEDFFVERAQMEWSSGAGERILLRRPVRHGGVVFLRLIHPTDLGPAFPVAYVVEEVRKHPGARLWELRLKQLRTRPTLRKEDDEVREEVLQEQVK